MKHVRSQNLQYTNVTRVVAPKSTPHPFIGISAQLDANSSSLKPKIVWVEESNQPARKEYHVLLLRGDAEVEIPEYKNPQFLFTTYDQNRRTGGVATAWIVEPIPKQEPEPSPVPKRPKVDFSTPESREAIEEAKKKEDLKRTQDEALKNPLVEALEEDLLEELFGENNES